MRNKPAILKPPPPEPIPPPEPPGWFGFEPSQNSLGASFSCEAWFLIVLIFLVGVAVGIACYGVFI